MDCQHVPRRTIWLNANYIHPKKMIPAGVKYFWEDIVCKYWKWARKAVGLEGRGMKPALSIMHNIMHNI